MHVSIILSVLATASFTSASIPRELVARADSDYVGKACTIDGISPGGHCKQTSDCVTTGFNSPNFCPGSTAIQCCVEKTCGSGGTCQNVGDNACDGEFADDLCPGDDGIKCCVPKGSGGTTPLPPTGGGDTTPSFGDGSKILSAASSEIGKYWYVWGGGGCKGPSANGGSTVGFDCSGLTQYALCQAFPSKAPIPRTAETQFRSSAGKRLPRSQAEPGDLVFWGDGPKCAGSVGHVGVVKTAKGGGLGLGIMVNAAHTGTKVREQDIWQSDSGAGESLCDEVVRFW